MARFRFILDPLLKIRRLKEDRCQQALAHLERSRFEIEEALRQCQKRLGEGKEEVRRAVSGRVDLVTMRTQAQASLHTVRQANQLVLQLAGLQKQIDRARMELLEARRDRRAIEQLRERRYQDWRARRQKREIGRIDELAVIAVHGAGAEPC